MWIPSTVFKFEENNVPFKEVFGPKEYCGACDKRIKYFYNEDYDIHISVCSNPECMQYIAFDHEEFKNVLLDFDQINLIGYYDSKR